MTLPTNITDALAEMVAVNTRVQATGSGAAQVTKDLSTASVHFATAVKLYLESQPVVPPFLLQRATHAVSYLEAPPSRTESLTTPQAEKSLGTLNTTTTQITD